MNTFVIMLYSYVFVCHRSSNAKFTALSDGPYSLKLYERVRNLHAPSDSDPATRSVQIRKDMCKDIFESEWFIRSNAFLVDQHYVDLHPTNVDYARIYARTYAPRTLQNAYRRRRLIFELRYFVDYSFLCPVNYENSVLGIVMFAVTKEYDVSAAGQPYKPGHFVTTRGLPVGGVSFQTILAEEPAVVHIRSSVDVERYYKNVRRYIEPASGNDLDPLCRMISADEDDINNLHFRLCTAVLRSTDFENVGYPNGDTDVCSLREVSFRENENNVARERGAVEKRYSERMTQCHVLHFSGEVVYVYISRAYRSNQLFVYTRDSRDDKIYLVNLSINVSIVDELNSFNFLE